METGISKIKGLGQEQSESYLTLSLKLLDAGLAAETKRAYARQLKTFLKWCKKRGASALPASPETVALFLMELAQAGQSHSSISQAAAAIRSLHTTHSPNPADDKLVRAALRASARRALPVKPKAALELEDVQKMIDAVPFSLQGLRDRALLAVGFMGGFRRSELSALKAEDLDRADGAFLVHVRRSKTDQTGQGMTKALFHTASVDAVQLLEDWLKTYSPAPSAPLFPAFSPKGIPLPRPLGDHQIARIVKKHALNAGIQADVSGHSLRRGFVTSALKAGASERSIMNQTGHRSVAVMRRYAERHTALEDNAAKVFAKPAD